MDMAGVVVAVGEDSDPMYGSVMWGIVQGTYAQCALLTCSLTVRALSDKGSRWIGFSFSQQDVEKTISLEGSAKILVDGALCTEVEQGRGHQVKSASRTSLVSYAR